MTTPMSNEAERALAELQEHQAQLFEIQRSLSSAENTVTSKNHAVAVTVDSNGKVTGIKFPTASFRKMAGPELGRLLVETIEAARNEALAATIAAFGAMPGDLPMLDLLTGGADEDEQTAGPSRLERLLDEVLHRPMAGQDEEGR